MTNNNNKEDLNISYRSLRKSAENSTSIILPRHMIELLQWNYQDTIKIIKEGNKLVLERVELGDKTS